MFNETNYSNDPINVLEERKLMEQIVSLGVGYTYGNRLSSSPAAISHADMLYRLISKTINFRECPDASNIICDAQASIRNGDNGYYLLDLHKGCLLVKGQHPIEDILIDFTFRNTTDRVSLRKRKGVCLHNIRFLAEPDVIYFLGMNRICIPLKEFHALSFIRLDGDFKTGFVVDYDAARNDRPLILFPCKENSSIIQAQLDHDDHCCTMEWSPFTDDISFT